jgi:hypothetical protein
MFPEEFWYQVTLTYFSRLHGLFLENLCEWDILRSIWYRNPKFTPHIYYNYLWKCLITSDINLIFKATLVKFCENDIPNSRNIQHKITLIPMMHAKLCQSVVYLYTAIVDCKHLFVQLMTIKYEDVIWCYHRIRFTFWMTICKCRAI